MRAADKQGMRIDTITRRSNSTNGNPRYTIRFVDGSVHDTQTDASINYEITNREFRQPISLWLTKAGRIEYARIDA